MRLIAAISAMAIIAPAAPRPSDWSAVQSLSAGQGVEAVLADKAGPRVKGRLIRADAAGAVVATRNGEVAVSRAQVKVFKVHAPERRTRNGLIGLATGAGVGIGLGVAICPYCRNEGHSGFFPSLIAVCTAVGATAFAFTPYRTIYRAPKR